MEFPALRDVTSVLLALGGAAWSLFGILILLHKGWPAILGLFRGSIEVVDARVIDPRIQPLRTDLGDFRAEVHSRLDQIIARQDLANGTMQRHDDALRILVLNCPRFPFNEPEAGEGMTSC